MNSKLLGALIDNSKLLGALIDNKLTFDKRINNLCAKASQELNALCRVSSFIYFIYHFIYS